MDMCVNLEYIKMCEEAGLERYLSTGYSADFLLSELMKFFKYEKRSVATLFHELEQLNFANKQDDLPESPKRQMLVLLMRKKFKSSWDSKTMKWVKDPEVPVDLTIKVCVGVDKNKISVWETRQLTEQ